MPIQRPFKRTVRQFTNGSYSEGGRWAYITHKNYAKVPEHYIRAFLLLQKDLLLLFDYVEPADINLKTYSYRIHELLLRTCIEIEANLVAILKENGFNKSGNWNILDYKKINLSHRLSSYEIKLPVWNGEQNIRKPFVEWETKDSLVWYQAYNKTKHDRQTEFQQATFENLLEAFCGLYALLSSQFYTHEFSSSDSFLVFGGMDDGMESGIGSYFRVKFPNDWPEQAKYDFNWRELENMDDPFQQHNYN